MWKQTTSTLLVILLINFSSGAERWYKSMGVANIDCPLNDDPDDPTVLPYQGDCSKFIKCSYGMGYTLACPRGLEWSVALERCEAPLVAMCNRNAVTNPPVIGDGCAYSYRPHPYDCSKFIQCVSGRDIEIECPGGSKWDRTSNQCSFADNVICI